MRKGDPGCSAAFRSGIGRVLLAGLLLSPHAVAEEDLREMRSGALTREWLLVQQDRMRNIKTWARREEGKNIRSWRVEAELAAPFEAIGRLHTDVELMPRWYWETRHARLLKQVSATEFVYYMQFNAPLGLPDRDVVLRAVIEPLSAKRPFMVIRVQALPDYLPPQPGLVRVPAQDFTVRLTPLSRNRTRFEAEGYVDPGGAAPAWVVNFVQRRVPYQIMLSMIRMLQKKEYAEPPSSSPYRFSEP